MSSSVAYRHQLRALLKWPKDKLRPDTQFQDVIQRRIDRRLGLTQVEPPKKSKEVVRPPKPWVEVEELKQANALYSLIEGRYTRKFPITGNLLKPASNPTYYTDLIAELDAAPTRSIWGRIGNRLKGMLRFQ